MTTPTRWAILIGIDEYSDTRANANLHGCVNDVDLIYDHLTRKLGWAGKNIYVLIAPHSHHAVANYPQQYLRPSRKNVLKTIKRVQTKGKRDDVVLIHYSGHGDYRNTLYSRLKGSKAYDELLCLLDHDMSDVHFGRVLDDLAAKFTLLATLDCCYSGGATRGEQLVGDLVRAWPSSETRPQVENTPQGPDENNEPDEEFESESDYEFDDAVVDMELDAADGAKNASVPHSWLHRHRRYNVLSACQAHQRAKETAQGRRNGVWTKAFIDTLVNMGPRARTETYAELHKRLSFLIKQQGKTQRPLHFGEPHRQIFDAAVRDSSDFKKAYVTDVQAGRVTINKGALSGVLEGDMYELESDRRSTSTQSSSGDRRRVSEKIIVISKTQSYATGRIVSNASHSQHSPIMRVEDAWIATLVSRKQSATAMILRDQSDTAAENAVRSSEAIETIRSSWQDYFDPVFPVTLTFEDDDDNVQTNPNFLVRLGEKLTFYDVRGVSLQHFPTLKDYSHIDVASHVMALLRHVQRYESVKILQSPSQSASDKPYKLRFDRDSRTEPGAVSSWKFRVTNNYKYDMLYVTVLNLSPLFGISRMFPRKHEGSAEPIEPRRTYRDDIDIYVPETLKREYKKTGFSMEDIFKVFITTELPKDDAFDGFYLEDLIGEIPDEDRTGAARARGPVDPWWIETLRVTTH